MAEKPETEDGGTPTSRDIVQKSELEKSSMEEINRRNRLSENTHQ